MYIATPSGRKHLQAIGRKINRTFKDRDSFKRFRIDVVGEFLAVRCEGAILTDLAYDVGRFIGDNRDRFDLSIDPEPASCGWYMDGTVISFRIV